MNKRTSAPTRTRDVRRFCQPLLRCVLLVCLSALTTTVAAAESTVRSNPQTFTFLFENDLFGDTDQQYTNGMRLSWISPDLKRLEGARGVPPWLLSLVRRLNAFESLVVEDPKRQFNVGFGVGQMMFTPEDTESVALVEDDRPYAGWLYGEISFVSKTDSVADTLELQGGMIGPASLAKKAQFLVHDIRDIDKPRGWQNQLSNEPGILIYYERKWRVLRGDVVGKFGYDLITHAGAAVGNVMDYGALGAEARMGWNLPHDFGTSLIRPGGDANAPTTVSGMAGAGRGLGIYGFAGAGGRLVGRNIFLDGNTFEDSHEVDSKWLVGDLIVGASVIYGNAKLSYAQVFRTREFDGQDGTHNFGSMSLSWSF